MHVEGVLANNDYILNGCYIEITSNCNLRCIHCYNESGELRDQISVEAFKNVLGCYDNPKKASITLSGGEPLLHPQVWKFIDMMLESGILARNILLITNATCITDDVANMLAEKHVSVQVSLNGSRAELHDSICGKGNFERTMAGLQRLLSKHANMVIVRNMMNKQNMNDNWDMFCEKLIDMGVHKIMLAGLKKVGRANENLEKIALTPLEYQSLIDRLKESKVITGINDEYRKLAGDEAESNIRIDIPVPYSGVCPYVYQDENPVDSNGVELSGGQWKRIALYRTLHKKDVDLIVLDEPTANLDPKISENIINRLLKPNYNKTVIVITHDFELAKKFDRIIGMKEGKIICDSPPQAFAWELFEKHNSDKRSLPQIG